MGGANRTVIVYRTVGLQEADSLMLLTSRQKEVVKPQLWKVWHYLFLLCS